MYTGSSKNDIMWQLLKYMKFMREKMVAGNRKEVDRKRESNYNLLRIQNGRSLCEEHYRF